PCLAMVVQSVEGWRRAMAFRILAGRSPHGPYSPTASGGAAGGPCGPSEPDDGHGPPAAGAAPAGSSPGQAPRLDDHRVLGRQAGDDLRVAAVGQAHLDGNGSGAPIGLSHQHHILVPLAEDGLQGRRRASGFSSTTMATSTVM